MEGGLRSADAFRVRRCQIVLASEYGAGVPRIRAKWGAATKACAMSCTRSIPRGAVACLQRGSSRPHTTRGAWGAKELSGSRPCCLRVPGPSAPPVCGPGVSGRGGLCPRPYFPAGQPRSDPHGLCRLGVSWQRAKHWITSPDPAYARKKSPRPPDALGRSPPEWALGFEDETWWSRLAQPALHAWPPVQQPLHLVEQTVPRTDPDPKALACYGLLVQERTVQGVSQEHVWLRFVADRPVSAVTVAFLTWVCAQLGVHKTALLLVWDTASWHGSQAVRQWLREA